MEEASRGGAMAPRRPGGTQKAKDILETECVFSYAPAHKSDASDHFRVDGSDVTITVHCACAQEFADVRVKIAGNPIPNTEDTPPEPLQQRLFGERLAIAGGPDGADPTICAEGNNTELILIREGSCTSKGGHKKDHTIRRLRF